MEEWKKHNSKGLKIDEAVKRYVKAMGVEEDFYLAAVLNTWEEELPKDVSNRISSKQVKNKVLILDIESSVMREELAHKKSEIINRINELSGKELIIDVFLK